MLTVDTECCISIQDDGMEVLHIENDFDMKDIQDEIKDLAKYINSKEVVISDKDCIDTKSLFSIRKNILKGRELKEEDLNNLNKETLVMMVLLINEDYSLLKDIHYKKEDSQSNINSKPFGLLFLDEFEPIHTEESYKKKNLWKRIIGKM